MINFKAHFDLLVPPALSFIVLCTSKDKMLHFTLELFLLCTLLITVLNKSFI